MKAVASQIDQRITIQRQQFAQNPLGENVAGWVDVATVWARAEPIRGREYFAAVAAHPVQQTDVRFTLRYRTGITQSMRVLWAGFVHQIESVIQVDGRHRTIELMTVRGPAIALPPVQVYGDPGYFSGDDYYTTGVAA